MMHMLTIMHLSFAFRNRRNLFPAQVSGRTGENEETEEYSAKHLRVTGSMTRTSEASNATVKQMAPIRGFIPSREIRIPVVYVVFGVPGPSYLSDILLASSLENVVFVIHEDDQLPVRVREKTQDLVDREAILHRVNFVKFVLTMS